MSKRSVSITFSNNTQSAVNAGVTLTHYYESICHGSWGPISGSPTQPTAEPNSSLPGTIAPGEIVTWSSADSELSVGAGTQAWVKYTAAGENIYLSPANPEVNVTELVYICWDNPFDWGEHTVPLNGGTSLSNISPPCGDDGAVAAIWGVSSVSGFPAAVPGTILATELFSVGASSSPGPQSIDTGSGLAEVWNGAVGWPLLAVEGLINAEKDINLHFTIGLRLQGSVMGSIRNFYDGKKGVRALASKARQPSLRKLFNL